MLDTFDATLLARIQFGFTVAFHFIFPAFTIGLASFLAVLNGMWLYTRDEAYLQLFKFWVKIFAVAFAMGVVSGLTMSYQFGTNWSVFADKTGPVLGPLMAYEVLTAFFLEAGFLGIMLFGREKVGNTLHMVACLMVAIGTAVSASWILSVNSWMQTPVGFTIAENGQFMPADWWQIIFNPSFPYRFAHTLTAAYLTTAFIVGGVGAYHLVKGRKDNKGVRTMFSMAMWMAAIVAPIQVFLGDQHGLNTLKYQPTKVAAMEGHYEDYPDGAPLCLFGIPNPEAQRLDYAICIPHLSSVILTHTWDGALTGLKSVPLDEQPPVGIVFFAFRVMVGIGMLMVLTGVWSLYLRYRRRLYDAPLFHRFAVMMGPAGLVAVIAGWLTTEVGRQPFTVYGVLRTADSVSPLGAPAVAASLMAYVVVYFVVFGAGVFYIFRLMGKPPLPGERGIDRRDGPIRTAGITPAVQFSADGPGREPGEPPTPRPAE
ncbi:MAG: cytochrome ubiquinol oxidase subunit I [Pseudomonadota bacterium]